MQETTPRSLSQPLSSIGLRLLVSTLYTIPHFIAIFTAIEFLRVVVKGFFGYFDKHDIPVSPLAMQYYQMADWVGKIPVGLLMIAILVDFALILGLLTLPKNLRWIAQVWIIGFLVAVIFFLYFGSLSIGIPFYENDLDK